MNFQWHEWNFHFFPQTPPVLMMSKRQHNNVWVKFTKTLCRTLIKWSFMISDMTIWKIFYSQFLFSCARAEYLKAKENNLLWRRRKKKKKKIVLLSINTAVHTQFFFQFFLTLFSRTNETIRVDFTFFSSSQLSSLFFLLCGKFFMWISLKNNQFDLNNCGIETSKN